MRTLAVALLAVCCAPQGHVSAVQKENIEWKAAPGLSGGIMTSIIWGETEKGPYQAMIKFPAGILVTPHFHKIDEFATVVSGSVIFGQGETVDEARGVEVSAGGYVTIPGGTAHWAKCVKDAIIVRFAPGPRDITMLKEGEKAPGTQAVKIVQAKDVPWEDAPGMVKGVKTVLQYGDPKVGPYIILLKFPKGIVNPSHYHTADEAVTILSGTMVTGEGETIDDAKGKDVSAGGYFIIPGRTPHWGKVTGDDVVLTRLGNGPRDIFYFDKK
jgi:quercetin dioxygenase-like cupin family protein